MFLALGRVRGTPIEEVGKGLQEPKDQSAPYENYSISLFTAYSIAVWLAPGVLLFFSLSSFSSSAQISTPIYSLCLAAPAISLFCLDVDYSALH